MRYAGLMLVGLIPVMAAGQDASPDPYDTAKALFDQLAPPEIKEKYDFPTRQQLEDGLTKLQTVLDSGSLSDIAQYAQQARDTIAALRTIPGYGDYADWLQAKLDELDAAADATRQPEPPSRDAPAVVPYYHPWISRVRGRPLPPNARALMPRLEAAFRAEGVPPQLAWVAEAESSLNPNAQSPAGAKGLFQLKSETAKQYGLSTFLPDQRTDPDRSARAAAQDLRALGHRFGSWPLALAAYNAGEGRVSRLLAAHHAHTFAEIAPALPGETRMYVPKVCALVALRSGFPVDRLPPP